MIFKLSTAIIALAALASTATLQKRVTCPDGNVVTNAACCPFFDLVLCLQTALFNNECGEDVHEVLHLAFNDAIGFSKSGEFKGTGADGSIILFDSIELTYPANIAVVDAANNLKPFLFAHNFSAGDLIQFAAAVGLSNCPGAPRLQFLAGRPNATMAADLGTVPQPQDSVTTILARMADTGFAPSELVHLLAAHTLGHANHVDPTVANLALDSTPFTFDTQFFLEVLLKGVGFPGSANNVGEVESPLPAQSEIRLQSDFAIARDSRTACEWQSMVANQKLMMSNFQTAMAKLATVGQNVNTLVDCSNVIPVPPPPATKPATFPAGTDQNDVQQACAASPAPTLMADPGAATLIPACPGGDPNVNDCAPLDIPPCLDGEFDCPPPES